MVLASLLTLLVIATAGFSLVLFWTMRRGTPGLSLEAGLVSLIANFFDTLGIGSFAPTTAYMKFRNLVPDEQIPPSLIAGYALPTAVEALVFIANVRIDIRLLAGCILMAIIGALLGSSVAARLPVRLVRASMGTGLLIAAVLFALANVGLMPAGGTATSLEGGAFVLALGINFGLGVLMNLGIGSYGPLLIALSLLGLDPRAAFPVMMGSSAFLMLATGAKILLTRRLSLPKLGGLALGGIPGVLAAAFIVRTLPLRPLRWGVVVVATYAGVVMLLAARNSTAAAAQRSEQQES